MKVVIHYSVEVDDEGRRAIRRYYGQKGMATRAEVKHFHEEFGHTMDMDLISWYGDDSDNAREEDE